MFGLNIALALSFLGTPVWAQETPVPAVDAPVPAADAPEPAVVETVAPVPLELRGKITEIQIQGLRRVEEAALMASIGLRTGELIAGWKVQRDLISIYQTGFVEDVKVDVSPAENQEVSGDIPPVVVTFIIDEKPAIREVTISGNKKIDEDSIREVIDIPTFAVLNQSEIKDNIARIREKYLEKGFYLAEIEPKVHVVADDIVELEFAIKEHKKVRVQRIDIVGNEKIPDHKIRKFMQTKQAGIVPWLTNSGVFNEAILEADTQIVRTVFLEEGFVDVKIEPATTYLSPDKRFIYATIHVTEGPQYTLGRISVAGDFTPEEGLTKDAVRQIIAGETAKNVRLRYTKARKKEQRRLDDENATAAAGWETPKRKSWLDFTPNPPMETGETFKLTTMQIAMQQIADLYGDEGYAFTNVVPQTDPHPE